MFFLYWAANTKSVFNVGKNPTALEKEHLGLGQNCLSLEGFLFRRLKTLTAVGKCPQSRRIVKKVVNLLLLLFLFVLTRSSHTNHHLRLFVNNNQWCSLEYGWQSSDFQYSPPLQMNSRYRNNRWPLTSRLQWSWAFSEIGEGALSLLNVPVLFSGISLYSVSPSPPGLF